MPSEVVKSCTVRNPYPLQQGLRLSHFYLPHSNRLRVRNPYPLQQGLRPSPKWLTRMIPIGQKPISITTRIKTSSVGAGSSSVRRQKPISITTRIKTYSVGQKDSDPYSQKPISITTRIKTPTTPGGVVSNEEQSETHIHYNKD